MLTAPVTPALPAPMFGTDRLAVELESVLIFKVFKAVVAPITWRVIVPVPPSIVKLSPLASAPSIEVLNVIAPSSLSMITVPSMATLSLKTISPFEPSV